VQSAAVRAWFRRGQGTETPIFGTPLLHLRTRTSLNHLFVFRIFRSSSPSSTGSRRFPHHLRSPPIAVTGRREDEATQGLTKTCRTSSTPSPIPAITGEQSVSMPWLQNLAVDDPHGEPLPFSFGPLDLKATIRSKSGHYLVNTQSEG
jgi:hypothetical protein